MDLIATLRIVLNVLISKLIVWGRDRTEAIARAQAALEEYTVGGVATTIGFHRQVLMHPEFIAGHTTTDFIPRYFGDLKPESDDNEELRRAISLAATLYTRRQLQRRSRSIGTEGNGHAPSPWLISGRQRAMQRWPV